MAGRKAKSPFDTPKYKVHPQRTDDGTAPVEIKAGALKGVVFRFGLITVTDDAMNIAYHIDSGQDVVDRVGKRAMDSAVSVILRAVVADKRGRVKKRKTLGTTGH